MRKRLLIALIAPCILFATAALAQPWTGNFNLAFGVKALDEDDWEPVDDQTSFGAMLDFRRPGWPVNLAVDLLFSWDDDDETTFVPGPGVVNLDVEGRTTELNLGVRKLWENFPHLPSLTPYLGGGAAVVWAEQEVDGPVVDGSEDDTGLGFWVGGGAYFTLAEHFNLGVDLRYSYAKVDLFDDVNAGGFRTSVLVGYHW